jgi:hypothetical protein
LLAKGPCDRRIRDPAIHIEVATVARYRVVGVANEAALRKDRTYSWDPNRHQIVGGSDEPVTSLSLLPGDPPCFFVDCLTWADSQDVDGPVHEPVHDSEPTDAQRMKPEELSLKRFALRGFAEKPIDSRPNLSLEIGMKRAHPVTDLVGDPQPPGSVH